MKKQTIWILTILMAITFVGLLCIQIFYMKNIAQIRFEQFAQGVRQSLVATTMRLEQDEARHFLEDDVSQVETSAVVSQYGNRLPSLGGIKYSFTTRSASRPTSHQRQHKRNIQTAEIRQPGPCIALPVGARRIYEPLSVSERRAR